MLLTNNKNTISYAVVWFILLVAAGFFVYRVATSVIIPFYFGKVTTPPAIALNAHITETATYLTQRGLTPSSSSATLINSEEKFLAEVINASGLPNAARLLADELAQLGITVSSIGNSQEELNGSVLSLKDSSLVLANSITAKISTDSAKVRVEKLDETYPFDIRIVIGK